MPDVAVAALNHCVSSRGRHDATEYEIVLDFEFLDDAYYDWKKFNSQSEILIDAHPLDQKKLDTVASRLSQRKKPQPYSKDTDVLKRNNPLMLMVLHERQQLLSHPLVLSLLKHKWNSYGKYVYYSALAIYILFLSLLTGYMLSTPPPYKHYPRLNAPETESFEAVCHTLDIQQRTFPHVAKYFIMLLTIFHTIKELFQMVQRREKYFSWENLIELFVNIAAFIFVVDFSDCTRKTGLRFPWQWQLGTVCIFLAWMNCILFIRKFPRFGIYVVMFTDILKTFARFFLVFLLFVMAFALSFHALFQDKYPFREVWPSIAKTTVMMIGEFEFDSIFNDPAAPVRLHAGVPNALFYIFMLLMTILLMNLLVGLAVDDIQSVQHKAALKRLAMQVELVLHVEQVLPQWLLRRWVIKTQVIRPNKETSIFTRIRKLLFSAPSQLSSQNIAKKLNLQEANEKGDNNGGEMSKEAVRKAEKIGKKVEVMERQLFKMDNMLRSLIRHFHVQWEEQDDFHTTL